MEYSKTFEYYKKVGIEDIEYFLPSQYMTSNDLASKYGFSISFIEEKVGVKGIYIAGEDENTSDLAVEAIRKIFEKRPDLQSRIGVIAVCTQTPDFQLPHTAALVQKKLGLGVNIACFDLGLGCSGFVYGLSIVMSFMESNNLEYGILVTSEKYSKIIDSNDKNTKALFSDAAAATLLSRHPHLLPQKFTFGTDGEGYGDLILKPRGSLPSSDESYLYMNGRGVFGFVASVIPEDLRKCLNINEMNLDDIDNFVFHQASNFVLDALTKEIGISNDERVIKNINRFGNTVSSSIPISLKTIFDASKRKKSKILISGFGVGLSWASTVLVTEGEHNNV